MKKSKCTYMFTFILSCMLMIVMNVTTAKTFDKGEIKFKRDSHSGTVSGSVVRGDSDQYSLMAGAGQWMEVKISSLENNAVFQLSIYSYGTGEDVQLEDAKDGDDAKRWYGRLPTPGYSKDGKQNAVNIVIGGTRGNTSYDLTVTIKNQGESAEPTKGLVEQWIVTASGVRVRSAPNTSADVVAKLNFGTIVEQLGKTAKPARVGKTKAHWYHIRLPDGEKGWVFGSLIASLAASENVKTFRDIARQRLENQKLKIGELTDLFSFLTRVNEEVDKTIEIVAELKLMRLQTLQRVIEVVGWGWEKSPYKAWLKTQEKLGNIYYFDSAGAWFVDPNKYWVLSKQYRSLPIGDKIAWQAANLEIRRSECEGYLPCWVSVTNLRSGQYLALYPNGKHVNEAFGDAVSWISPSMDIINGGAVYNGVGNDKEEQKEFMKALRELCQILTPVSHPKKGFVRKEIDKMFKQLGSSDKCSGL